MNPVKEAMAKLVESYTGDTNVVVYDWTEDIEYGGFCETCSYEDYVVDITYGADDCAIEQNYRFSGTLSDLIRELTG